jgi:hypothetical protein
LHDPKLIDLLGLFGDTLNYEKSFPFNIDDFEGSSKPLILSLSVSISFISSSGSEKLCAI